MRQRIIAMCQGGHVRSVALKYLLKYGGWDRDALTCGWQSNTQETREMLYRWADTIIVMQPEFDQFVPEKYHDNTDGSRRLFCFDVGVDRFGNPFHPELQAILVQLINESGLF